MNKHYVKHHDYNVEFCTEIPGKLRIIHDFNNPICCTLIRNLKFKVMIRI
jgi:hypothetical protein